MSGDAPRLGEHIGASAVVRDLAAGEFAVGQPAPPTGSIEADSPAPSVSRRKESAHARGLG
jgi:hypothetical protein